MAGRTLLELIVQTLSEAGLPYHDGTSDGSGTTTVLRDAELSIWADNKWNHHFLYIDGGSPSQRQLRVTDFDQGNGDVTFTPTLGAAPDSLAYMIMPWTRNAVLEELKNAILHFHNEGVLLRELTTYGLVGQSPLYNAGWDYWTSATTPDGWAKASSGVIGREENSDNIFAGPQSMSLVTNADYVGLSAPWTRWLEDARNGTIRLYCPVLANNTSHARININVDGNNYSSYHTGGGDWEILDTGAIDVPSATNVIQPRLHNESTNKVYFGEPWIEMSNMVVRDYPYPADLMTRIASIKRSPFTQVPDGTRGLARALGNLQPIGGFEMLKHRDSQAATGVAGIIRMGVVPAGHRMEVRSTASLTIPSADTDIVEVTQTESLMLAKFAAANLLEDKARVAPVQMRRQIETDIGELRGEMNDLSRTGFATQAGPVELPARMW